MIVLREGHLGTDPLIVCDACDRDLRLSGLVLSRDTDDGGIEGPYFLHADVCADSFRALRPGRRTWVAENLDDWLRRLGRNSRADARTLAGTKRLP
jgi:hypothetical protein